MSLRSFHNQVLLLGATLIVSASAYAGSQNLDSDMDALGGNKDLIERANAINPKNTTRVVQKREVDRDNRLELDLNYGIVAGGDPFVNTNNIGAQLEYHLTPRWSFGARYYQSASNLDGEGQHEMDLYNSLRPTNPSYPRPDIDYQKSTYLGTVSFYPFYGKLSLADLAVTQFDIYFVAGGGAVTLDQAGSVPTYTAGMGLAFWFSKHFSARLEGRYQGYKDSYADGTSTQMDLTIFTLGFGYLL